jgi:FKBP-type peptidyl-prolyl cis-trans isomerase
MSLMSQLRSATRSVAPLLAFSVAACGGGEPVTDLPTFEARAAYAIGQNVGEQLAASGVELDLDALFQGFRDAMDGSEPLLDEMQLMETMQEFQLRSQEAMMREAEEAASANQAEGESYLAENAGRDGVVTTDTGLQYRVMVEGDGATPGPTDRVRVHYRGTFIDGEPFDSSYDRGEPAVFGVNEVIPGWTEALQLMQVGSRVELVIPGNLAYGQNAPPGFGPNRTLLFEVELLGIED